MADCHAARKILPAIFLLFLAVFFFNSPAHADIIKLKSGGRIEGVIQGESDGKVAVEIKFGGIILKTSDIESIEKATNGYNKSLKQRWEKEKSGVKAEIKQKINPPPTQPVKTPQPTQRPAQQPSKRKPGTVIIVKCEGGAHSYAACLPSDYEQRGECPVLFCFDPGADGSGAVRKFAFAAEKYGWIVVGSLSAQNGPWEPIIRAQSAMLEDIKKRYKTNDDKYYAAGFSGGARMSYTIAYNHPSRFKGVIACGAGFGQGSISRRVSVYNCVGEKDSNLNEVKKAREELRKRGIKSELNVFPGGHDWPPDPVIKQAVDWIAKN